MPPQRSPLLPMFLIVLVDVLGFTIVIPLLGLYAERFGATPLIATLIVLACAALAGLVGVGRAADPDALATELVETAIAQIPVALVFLGLTLLVFALSLLALRVGVQKQFFPASQRLELLVDLWLPQGASLKATEAQVQKVEKQLLENPELSASVTKLAPC